MGNRLTNEEIITNNIYDIIVVGGGHAGIEASLASARIGLSTLMVCGSYERIGNMPCNPSTVRLFRPKCPFQWRQDGEVPRE